MKKNVLVFPCGSEIGLEIYRSVKYSSHFVLFGASSVDDHGEFVYENYIGGLPFINEKSFIDSLKYLIAKYKIDILYPTMDSVIEVLKKEEDNLGCIVVGPHEETAAICNNKIKTYQLLNGLIRTPRIYENINEIDSYPVFLKPMIGYGSRGTYIAKNDQECNMILTNNPQLFISEFLPGKEYTVDCFSDINNNVVFCNMRERIRINNGISVRSELLWNTPEEIYKMARKINNVLKMSGAWFFQVKKDKNDSFALLEVACRFGGGSSIYRSVGINFALLNLYNSMNMNTKISFNRLHVIRDASLESKYKIDIQYKYVYIDFDDCIIINNKINLTAIIYLYYCINNNIKIILLTKHEGDLKKSLRKYKLNNIFDRIIHIKKEDDKSKYIKNRDSIFIDDSFSEREKVKENVNIPVFSVDAIECLIH